MQPQRPLILEWHFSKKAFGQVEEALAFIAANK